MSEQGKTPVDPAPRKPKSTKAKGSDANVGSALRAAYQTAIDEKIPQEMLDLLGKLR